MHGSKYCAVHLFVPSRVRHKSPFIHHICTVHGSSFPASHFTGLLYCILTRHGITVLCLKNPHGQEMQEEGWCDNLAVPKRIHECKGEGYGCHRGLGTLVCIQALTHGLGINFPQIRTIITSGTFQRVSFGGYLTGISKVLNCLCITTPLFSLYLHNNWGVRYFVFQCS